jgi:3-oxoacyl-[acyl-carrier-protein] synthase-3
LSFPDVWLSAPVAGLPGQRYSNADLLERVRRNFRGTEKEWSRVEIRIRSLWRICGTADRWLEEDHPTPIARFAAKAAEESLAIAGVNAADLDLVLYGSIAREYYEPATAAEIAGRIGALRAMPMDVTSACAGMVLAVQTFAGRAAIDPRLKLGIVTTATLTSNQLAYDIQSPADVDTLGAGLTVGHAYSAAVLSRTPLPCSGRVVGALAEGLPVHHELCRAPVDGVFVSHGTELFALARHMPGHLRRLVESVGWTPGDVDLWVCHQPANYVLLDIARQLEVEPSRVPTLHGIYGNTADSAIPVGLWRLREQGRLVPGTKLVLCTAASGFVMASVAMEWGGS